jgi:hypothetical protein
MRQGLYRDQDGSLLLERLPAESEVREGEERAYLHSLCHPNAGASIASADAGGDMPARRLR